MNDFDMVGILELIPPAIKKLKRRGAAGSGEEQRQAEN